MAGLSNAATRLSLRLEDFLRVHNFSLLRAIARLAASLPSSDPLAKLYAIEPFLISCPPGRASRAAVVRGLELASASWPAITARAKSREVLERSIILKPPAGAERGVLLVQFEAELLKLVLSPTFPTIEEQYQIVFSATWQPFYSVPVLFLAAIAKNPHFIMPSARRDDSLVPTLGSNIIALPFQSSSWVSSRLYSETARKDIDLLMVANFARHKRHWRLFEALADLPSDLRVVVAGRPLGSRTAASLLDEARAFGVLGRFELMENPADEVLSNLLSRAKLLCALTHKEGSFIAVGEALMAGTPVGLYRDALIGSKEYIGPETGVLFEPRTPLAPQIQAFLARKDALNPAPWARQNISAERNHPVFNALLGQHNARLGLPWSRPVEPFCCVHFDYFYNDAGAEALHAPVYGTFSREFGIDVARPAEERTRSVQERLCRG